MRSSSWTKRAPRPATMSSGISASFNKSGILVQNPNLKPPYYKAPGYRYSRTSQQLVHLCSHIDLTVVVVAVAVPVPVAVPVAVAVAVAWRRWWWWWWWR